MTKDKEFVHVANLSDLKEKIGKKIFLGDDEVALFKIDGKIYALGNICPHQHASIIHQGFIEENSVVCPAHGWEFNLKTGRRKYGNLGIETYEVLVEKNKVFVKPKNRNIDW